MPIIKVWCLPNDLEEGDLRLLKTSIILVVGRVKELGLNKEDITVRFPRDMMDDELGAEVIAEVVGLFEKPERTDEVRNRLARDIGAILQARFPEAKIECLVYPFNPAQGFWSSDMKKT